MLAARSHIEAIIQDGNGWLLFRDPVRVLAATRAADVRPALRELERLTRDHRLHAVGWVSFEAGAAFGLKVHPGLQQWPLVWFAFFDVSSVSRTTLFEVTGDYTLGAVEPLVGRDAFRRGFNRIREHIGAGDSYQANFTFQTAASFCGDPRALFRDLVDAQRGRYSAFLTLGDIAVCSASPELFFELDGVAIRTRPMKGTAARGLTSRDDAEVRARLIASPKERAENVMIVDMMRNDLGRIAEVGSVSVPALFESERYPTLWQLTSQVVGTTSASLEEIFMALHPSASVTGAPKVRTMELLAGLETQPRGIYTGAIGHVPPDGNARFNVAIRTAVVDRTAGRIQFGVGSGIVWDSDADAEYDECLLKSAVLGRRAVVFDLLETLKWTDTAGFLLADRHLDRMAASADYFGIPWSRDSVYDALMSAVVGARGARRVRLLLGRDGAARVELGELTPLVAPLRVAFAQTPVSSADVWLHHKTTNRAVYDSARAAVPSVDDVVLWNEREEVTESTVANVVAEIDGARVTPPVSSGLLAGTFRAELLARGQIAERVIRREELRGVPLWLVNSVREWCRAELVP